MTADHAVTTTQAVIKHLSQPRWIAYLVVAVMFAVVTVLLGNWQYGRHEAKVERRDTIETNYGADPVSLDSVLDSPGDSLAPGEDWTRVEVSGIYREEDYLLVRNRPYRSVFGYEVLVPFSITSSQGDDSSDVRLLIDRGWVPNARNAATLPDVPAAPSGPVTVRGWLRPSEADFDRSLPQGQVASINLPVAEVAAGGPLYGAYLELESEDGTASTGERPAAADPPDTGLGVNFAYAMQWWIFSPIGLVLVVLMARREVRDAADGDSGVSTRPTSAKAKTSAKKKRIWDDEDY